MQLELLGTAGCHLCDEARCVVNEAQKSMKFDYVEIDIADNDQLMQAYSLSIPVLSSGRQQLKWPFSACEVIAFLSCPSA